jgi:hypothetical protein
MPPGKLFDKDFNLILMNLNNSQPFARNWKVYFNSLNNKEIDMEISN